MTDLQKNPVWMQLQHKMCLEDIEQYEWKWDVHPVDYGGPTYEHERDRFEYLFITMKDGRKYTVTRDTWSDTVYFEPS